MRLSVLGLSVCLATGIGCSIPHSVPEGRVVPGQTINKQGKVLIMNAADGQEQGQPVATGSGQEFVAAVRDSLLDHSVPASTAQTLDLNQACDEAQKMGFDYVLKPQITFWEDNATAWSGKGDKLRISIEVYDAKGHQLVGAATFYRVARGAGFVGSGTPERFLKEASAGALNKIYGWTPSK